jgi:hypothetical protein
VRRRRAERAGAIPSLVSEQNFSQNFGAFPEGFDVTPIFRASGGKSVVFASSFFLILNLPLVSTGGHVQERLYIQHTVAGVYLLPSVAFTGLLLVAHGAQLRGTRHCRRVREPPNTRSRVSRNWGAPRPLEGEPPSTTRRWRSGGLTGPRWSRWWTWPCRRGRGSSARGAPRSCATTPSFSC